MRRRIRRPSAGLIVAAIALFMALGGSAAAATGMFSGTQIKKNSIPLNRLTAHTRHALGHRGPRGYRGFRGHTGATGAAGAQGATGAQGAIGAAGPQGAKGDTGAAGPAGAIGQAGSTGAQGPAGSSGGDPNRLSQVSSLDPSSHVVAPGWGVTNGACGPGAKGSTSLDSGGIQITVPNDNAFGGAQYNPPSGITLNDISALSYTERYSGGTGPRPVFLEIDVTHSGSSVALSFSPTFEPAAPLVKPDVFQTWDVLAPGSTYTVNHQPFGTPLSTVLSTYGGDQVNDVQVQDGCSSGAAGVTATVSSVEMDAGSQVQNFKFGS